VKTSRGSRNVRTKRVVGNAIRHIVERPGRRPVQSLAAKFRSAGFAFEAESLEPRTLLSAVSWTNGDGTGVWSDPKNWSDKAVPGVGDDVTISGGVTINAFADVNSLTNNGDIYLPPGSLLLAGTLTNASGASIVGGSADLGADTLTNNGSINLDNDSEVTVSGTLGNTSGASISSGDTTISGDLQNAGTISVTSAQGLEINTDGDGGINSGSISASAGPLSLNMSSDTFANTGSISVASGQTLAVEGGTFDQNGGAIGGMGSIVSFQTEIINLNRDLSSAGSTFTASGSTINGPGTFTDAIDETLTLNGTTVDAPLVNNGTVNADDDSSIDGSFTNANGAATILNDVMVSGAMVNNGTLNISGGSFSGGGTLLNNGILNADGDSSIEGSFTTAVGSIINLTADDNNDDSSLDVANSFTNNGTINLVNNSVNDYIYELTVNGILTNASGASIIASGSSMEYSGAIYAVLANLGTVTITDTPGLTLDGDGGSNTGTIDVSGGPFTLAIEDYGNSSGVFTNNGAIIVASGQTLGVEDGIFNQNGGTLGGTGATLTFNDGTYNQNGGVLGGNGATLTFGDADNGAVDINLNVSFSGTDESLAFEGATINGPGTLTSGSGSTMMLDGAAVNAPLVNDGTLNVYVYSFIYGTFTTGVGSTINAAADADDIGDELYIADSFTNNGTINLANTTYTGGDLNVHGTLTNAAGGSIIAAGNSILDGACSLEAYGLVNVGTITISDAPGLTIYQGNLGYDNEPDGTVVTFTNSGTISITGGPLTIYPVAGVVGVFNNASAINVALGQTFIVDYNTFNEDADGTLGGGGSLNFFLATVNGPGTLTNPLGATLTLYATTITAPLVNDGTLIVLGGGVQIDDGSFTTGDGSTINLTVDDTTDFFFLGIANSFTNNGTINLVNNTEENPNASDELVIYGTLTNAPGGSIIVSGSSTQYGVTIAGDLMNAGALTISDVPGLALDGDFTQTTDGITNIYIGASGGTPQADAFDVTGTASLAGSLGIVLADGFVPTDGQSFTVVNYDSFTGTLNLVDPSGFTFTSAFNPTNLVVTAGGGQLIFDQQPTDTPGGAPINDVTVSIEDASGNVITDDNVDVTLEIEAGPSATLEGTVTEPTIDGVATFDDLSLESAGSYTLKATDGRDTNATSDTFNIGPIELQGDFTDGVSSGPVDMGLTPTGGDAFQSLLQVNGTVSYNHEDISASGTITSLIGNPSAGLYSFTGNMLIPEGATVASELTVGSSNIGIAGVPIDLTGLSLVSGDTGPEISLQGDIELPQPLDVSLSAGLLITSQGIQLASGSIAFPDEEFTLGELDISAKAMSISYDATDDELLLQGDASLDVLIGDTSAQANVSGDGNGIFVEEGDVYAIGSLSLSALSIDGWGLQNTTLNVDTLTDSYSGMTTLVIPGLPSIDASFELDEGQLDSLSISETGLNDPIADTGWFLNDVGGSVTNLSGGPITFTASMSVSLGPDEQIDIPSWLGGEDLSTSLAKLDISASITTADGFSTPPDISGSATLTIAGGMATLTGMANLNLANKSFSAKGSFNAADGVFIGSGSVSVNSTGQTTVYAGVALNLPVIDIPLYGSLFSTQTINIASGNFYLNYDPGNEAQDYIDLWGGANPLFPIPIGVHVGYSPSISVTPLYASNLPSVPSNSSRTAAIAPAEFNSEASPADTPSASMSFSVAPQTSWIFLEATWINGSLNVPIELEAPNGTTYTQSEIEDTPGMGIVSEMSDSTQETVGVSNPAAGDWTLILPNTSGLGSVSFNGIGGTPVTGAQLVFLQQPAGATAGATLSPTIVAVEDMNGNVIISDDSNVTLSLGTGSGLSGTLTRTATDGLVTFSNLSFSVTGNYTFNATDGSDIGATSGNITVGDPSLSTSAGAQYDITGPIGAQTLDVLSGTVTLSSDLSSTLSNYTLKIESGAKVVLDSDQNVGQLDMAANGTLNMGVYSLIINYGTNPDPIATILQYLASGDNGGAWNGPGIDSSAAATSDDLYGVGCGGGADNVVPGLTSGQIEVAYALYGDANLDGVVNAADYALIDNGFNMGLAGWSNGDFNYDGKINGDDYTLIDNAYNSQVSVSPRTYFVTSLADDGGANELRWAIQQANNAGGASTIDFASGLTGTITLNPTQGGELEISDTASLSIVGPGASLLSISGNHASNIFEIDRGAIANISGLTVTNGNPSSEIGGGIENGGTLTVTDCTISGNSAQSGGGIDNYYEGTLIVTGSTIKGNSSTEYGGGGILNGGTLTITNSTISDNSTTSDGGGIENGGTLIINDSMISGNSAQSGGGIDNNYGTLTITGSSFSANTATGDNGYGGRGGGIDNVGTLTITDSTISGNSATPSPGFGSTGTDYGGYGGGIENDRVLTVIESTISGNSALKGGGIFDDYGALNVTSSTISGNQAADGGGIYVGMYLGEGDATLCDTIVALNTTSGTTPMPSDISGILDSKSSYDLIGSGGAGGLGNTNGNIILTSSESAGLGSLADNGGPTQTIALLSGSPAIDAGSNALSFDQNWNPLTDDQRGTGFLRIVNNTVDIGAYEVQPSIFWTGGAELTDSVTAADYLLIDNAYNSQGSVSFAALPANVIAKNTVQVAESTDSTVSSNGHSMPAGATAGVLATQGVTAAGDNAAELRKRHRNIWAVLEENNS
jgi:hypothetical protein